MPTYEYICENHHAWFVWQSIFDDAYTEHACGAPCTRVIHSVPLHNHNPHIKMSNARDAREAKDLDAYARFRKAGHQPPGIDGCDRLEATATDDWYIKTGGLVSVPPERTQEINEMLSEGAVNPDQWSPVEQVHANRKED